MGTSRIAALRGKKDTKADKEPASRSRLARSSGNGSDKNGSSGKGEKKASLAKRGDDIWKTADTEAHRAEERARLRASGMGFIMHFSLKTGEEAEVVILDDKLSDGVAFYEHNLKGSDGKFGNREICIAERTNCPICDGGDRHYFVLKCTLLDLRGFKTRKGREVQQSRALLAIKQSQMQAWRELEAEVLDAHGTMRGTVLRLKRADGQAQNSASIGEPVAIKGSGGKLFDHLTEKELTKEFGHDAEMDREGKKVLRPKNADITVYDYEALYPPLFDDAAAEEHEDDLRQRFGNGPQAGSSKERLDTWGEGKEDKQERPAARSRRSEPEPEPDEHPARGRRRGAPEPEPETRTRGRKEAPAPAGRRSRTPFDAD